jgi:hypothetical protein
MAIILDLLLTNDADRPTVRLSGVEYEMRLKSDFTLEEHRRLERIGPRLGALLLKDELTPDEDAETSALLAGACQLALVAPGDVLARLGVTNQIDIAHAFFTLSTPSLQRTRARAEVAAPRPAGKTSSRGSSGSTAARRTSGSGRRRSGN